MCAPPLPYRHHSADSVSGGGVGRQPGQHLRHLSPAEPALPADPSHGANGPKRRHLEAAGLCGLRTQQGGLPQMDGLYTYTLVVSCRTRSRGTDKVSC